MEPQTLLSHPSENVKSLYPRKCDHCRSRISNERIDQNHQKRCERIRKWEENPRTCEICNTPFKRYWLYYRHTQICKPDKPFSKPAKKGRKLYHNCEHCGSNFRVKHKLQKHIPTCLKDESSFLHCFFPDCNKPFRKINVLYRHFFKAHGSDRNYVKEISFDSFSSFEQWLEMESIATFTSFKKYTGSKPASKKMHHYYCCQFYKPLLHKTTTSRRNKKGVIPRDINCPARIYAHESEGKINVAYILHHNHEISSENLKFHRLKPKRSVKESTDNNSMMLVPVQEVRENIIPNFPLEETFHFQNISNYRGLPKTLKNGETEKLASELVKLCTDPNFPKDMLKTIYITLNRLISGCQAAIKNAVGVKSISNASSNIKIAQIKKSKKIRKRKLPCSLQNDSQFVRVTNNRGMNPPSKCVKSVLTDSHSFKSSEKNECFTLPLNLTENVLDPTVTVNNYSINILELKSLDPFISDEEDNYLKSFSPHFQKGQLFDNVINAFISKILNDSPEILFIDATISRHISENLSATLYFKHNINLAKFILIPMYINSHWILVVADLTKKIFNIYDPLTETVNNCCLKIILKWFDIFNICFNEKCLWEIISPLHVLERDSLCSGVLICYYAYQLYKEDDPNESLDVLNFRKLIYNCLQNEPGNDPLNASVEVNG